MNKTLQSLILSLSLTTPVLAQDKLPEMTLKDVINYSTEYEVKKAPIPPVTLRIDPFHVYSQIVFGVTNSRTKEIVINDLVQEEYQKYTLIHELYHVHFDKYGVKQDEEQVDKYACATFKKLYEKSCPDFESGLEKVFNK